MHLEDCEDMGIHLANIARTWGFTWLTTYEDGHSSTPSATLRGRAILHRPCDGPMPAGTLVLEAISWHVPPRATDDLPRRDRWRCGWQIRGNAEHG